MRTSKNPSNGGGAAPTALRYPAATRRERFRSWWAGRRDGRRGLPVPAAAATYSPALEALSARYVSASAAIDAGYRASLAGLLPALCPPDEPQPTPTDQPLGPAARAAAAAAGRAAAADAARLEAADAVLVATEQARARIQAARGVAQGLADTYAAAVLRKHPDRDRLAGWRPTVPPGPAWLAVPGPHLLDGLARTGLAVLDVPPAALPGTLTDAPAMAGSDTPRK